jgi:hypothetical protein
MAGAPGSMLRRVMTRHYRLVVDGELGVRYSSAFEGMTISARGGATEIAGVIDRPDLQLVLARILALGLTLRSLEVLDGGDDQPEPDGLAAET